ncbi:MAG: hypothetical protein GC129_02225 [Proteobacteria bacterium]|nr:hypothetical protein [Pseudomonadota bacterium]
MRPSNPAIFLRFAAILLWGAAVPYAGAHAADNWVNMATVSPTSTLQAKNLCYTDGLDIACDGAAGTYTTSGTLAVTGISATGNVSANKFIGDGSGLTGVVASTADRITSGTTYMVVDGTSGYVSLTQATANTAWFDPTRGLVTLGVSATGGISATTAYFPGSVGIGQAPNLSYGLNTNKTIAGVVAAFSSYVQASNFSVATAGNGLNWGSNNKVTGDATNQYIALITSGTEALRIVSTGYVGIGTNTPGVRMHVVHGGPPNVNNKFAQNSATLLLEGPSYAETALRIGDSGSGYARISHPQRDTNGVAFLPRLAFGDDTLNSGEYMSILLTGTSLGAAGNVGIGTPKPNATLEVSGTISATSFVGNGSGLTGVIASTGDRIVSGTNNATSMIAISNTGYISITQAGANAAWFDPTRGLVTLGVSSTGTISGTSAYFSGDASFDHDATVNHVLNVYTLSVSNVANLPGTSITNNSSLSWGSNSKLSALSGNNSSKYLVFYTSNTEAMRIVSNSYVGIGTSSPTTALEVNGTISATNFVGNGSGLTNLNVSGDRLTSGSTVVYAISNTGYVSLTTGGTTWGYFSNAANYLPNLTTSLISSTAGGTVSSTNGYFKNISSTSLTNSGNLYVSGSTYVSDLTIMGVAGGAGVNPAVTVNPGGNNTNVQYNDNSTLSGSANLTWTSNTGVLGVTGIISATNTTGTVTATNIYGGYLSATTLTASTASFGGLAVSGNSALAAISSTNISATGNISAAKFIGDGSGLTNLTLPPTATDRISTSGVASGANLGMVVANNGTVSFTLGGTAGAAYLHPTFGFVGPGVSTTGPISATAGYFTNSIGVGMNVTGTYSLKASQAIYTGGILQASQGVFSGNTVSAYAGNATSPGFSFSNGGGLGIFAPTTTDLAITTSGTEALRIVSTGNVGIGTTAPNAKLDVYGTISATNISATGNVSANKFIGDGSGLTGVVASTADRITSGTTYMVVDGTSGYVSLTQATANTAWFDPTRGLVTLGVSTTGPISTTNAYLNGGLTIAGTNYTPINIAGTGNSNYTFQMTNAGSGRFKIVNYNTGATNIQNYATNSYANLGLYSGNNGLVYIMGTGNVGINNSAPSDTLHVSGTARITSWTTIAANTTPTTALDVYGTISATNFVGDGSGLTNLTLPATATDRISTSGVASGANLGMVVANNGTVSFTLGGTAGAAYLHPTLGLVAPGVSTTGPISATRLYSSGNLTVDNSLTAGSAGIGNLAAINISATNVSVTGNVSAAKFIGDGSGLTGISTQGDRIISTSANILAYAGGTISLTTGGTSGTSYFNTTGIWVGPGISTTGVISGTSLFLSSVSTTAGVTPTITSPGDNLGNHTATQNLNMGGYSIASAANISATGYVSASAAYFSTVSATGLKMTSPTTLTCGSGDFGLMRYNGTSGKMQICLNR